MSVLACGGRHTVRLEFRGRRLVRYFRLSGRVMLNHGRHPNEVKRGFRPQDSSPAVLRARLSMPGVRRSPLEAHG